MSIARDLKALIETYPDMATFALRVDPRAPAGEGYAIYPGDRNKLEEDMTGRVTWEAQYLLQASRYTADDQMRLENCDWVEAFQDWVQGLNRQGVKLTDAEFVSIEAKGGFFDDWDDNEQCGTYQVPIILTYEKEG